MNRRHPQLLAHEGLHLAVEHVVAADEPQLLEQLAREESDDGAIVGRAGAIELDGVVRLGIQHQLEDDFARLLLGERLHRQPGIPQSAWIERVQVLEGPVKAARQSGQNNVERVEVLVRVLSCR